MSYKSNLTPSGLYDTFYKQGERVLKMYNPCNIHMVNEKLVCNGPTRDPNWCCEGCQHHDPQTGCQVRALGCKLWLCSQASDNVQARIALTTLRVAGYALGLPTTCIRESKERWEARVLGSVRNKG